MIQAMGLERPAALSLAYLQAVGRTRSRTGRFSILKKGIFGTTIPESIAWHAKVLSIRSIMLRFEAGFSVVSHSA